MRPLLLIALDQAFIRHDLHELQDGGVADRFGFAERGVHVANRGSAPLPKDSKDFQLAVGGTRLIGFSHRMQSYYEALRNVNEDFRSTRGNGRFVAYVTKQWDWSIYNGQKRQYPLGGTDGNLAPRIPLQPADARRIPRIRRNQIGRAS